MRAESEARAGRARPAQRSTPPAVTCRSSRAPVIAGWSLLCLALAAISSDAPGAAAAARAACDRYASIDGSDREGGTRRAPYRSVAHLLEQTRPGETACLVGGAFAGDVAIRRGGSRGRPLTLTSAPGYRARILGVVYVADSADDLVISNLDLDGRNDRASPSPQINGDRVTLSGNDITNEHTAICVILGGSFERYGRAVGPVLTGNRIHDCGRLPPTRHDHGIYVEGADGARIVDNAVYDNADWGIHLYPSAQQSYIAHNVVDGNGHGILFASENAQNEYSRSHVPDGNRVEYNVLSNSTIGYNVEASWGGPVGSGNVVRGNCVWNGREGAIESIAGFDAIGNNFAEPRFVDRTRKDFRLRPSSPCAGTGLTRNAPAVAGLAVTRRRGGAMIRLRISKAAAISVSIDTTGGRSVSRLLRRTWQPGGAVKMFWNGKSDIGRSAPSGTYVVRVRAVDLLGRASSVRSRYVRLG